MPLNLASPGIVVREVDLTLGRVDPTSDKVAAIVAPFAQGPVEVPTLVSSESDLLATFGEAYEADRHYEHWMVASSFLSYGGQLRVVRADDDEMKNAYAGTASSAPKINSIDDYLGKGYDDNNITGVTVAARNPGSWANGVVVSIIDSRSDQIVAIGSTAGVSVGMGVTQKIPAGTVVAGVGSTSILTGYFKGVVTNVLRDNKIEVKFVASATPVGLETAKDYQEGGIYRFSAPTATLPLVVHTSAGVAVSTATTGSASDWFNQQNIELSNGSIIQWDQIASRPGTSAYADARNGRFDELHIVVVDDKGEVTGNPGTILEKHLNLSKATDAQFVNGSNNYYRDFAANGSKYIFMGGEPSDDTTKIAFEINATAGVGASFVLLTDTAWDQNADGIAFSGLGNTSLTLKSGTNYGGTAGITTTGSLKADIAEIVAGYELLTNAEEFNVDFILQGSGNYSKEETQAIGQKAIDIAERRKDALAFLSPHRSALFNETGTESSVRPSETITDNVLEHYSTVTSSTFAVLDSGYKYMYDRFADKFRYVPLNGDIAGCCVRTDINSFPWFSPAGTSRGAILNAVKLPYNPSKTQRDRLYSNRINPVTFLPGSGIVLFGDKTASAKQSAFDRINVRRLFLYLEKAISSVARDQLFEFNDEITRTNFVNAVEPFLREVQSNRGVQEFVVVCDTTNNTEAVIDRNEFVADIFIKPARSINFIGLTFVATRTGVSFEEIIGNV